MDKIAQLQEMIDESPADRIFFGGQEFLRVKYSDFRSSEIGCLAEVFRRWGRHLTAEQWSPIPCLNWHQEVFDFKVLCSTQMPQAQCCPSVFETNLKDTGKLRQL